MEGNGRAIYEKGKTDKALSFIKALLEEHYSYNQITSLLHLSKEESDKYRALLNLE